MLGRLRRYVRAHGVRGTAQAVGRRLFGLLYMEERLIVISKDLDSIVEPWRAGELRFEHLGAEHLPALSQLNRKRGRPGSTVASRTMSRRAFTDSSHTARGS